jgi:N-methylhydantoinase B
MAGGEAGRGGDIWVNPQRKDAKRLPTRYADYPLKEGDAFRLDSPGGGGYGDPLSRPAELVLADVREGNVSPQAAERDYGVVLTADHHAVDAAATARKRRQR